jgi:hypothetical protein
MTELKHTRSYTANELVQKFTRPPGTNLLLWAAFIMYVIVVSYIIAHHEMWGDEIHSWNIAKGSASFLDLINNTRYEGHPPVWYTILWIISKFTHDLAYVQAVHLAIASMSIFLILFFSPFRLSTRLLMPFGYYFLFEYAVLSRNYAIGVLLAIGICIVIRRHFRYKLVLYYSLLFLLSNTHLLALLLAASLHIYFLLWLKEQNKQAVLHILWGIVILFPALYFIFPPSDSEMNVQFWLDKWGMRNLKGFVQSPLRAFIPVSSPSNYNFWNTQILIETQDGYGIMKYTRLLISAATVLIAFFILRKNRKSLFLFLTNLALSFVVAMVFFTLASARYAGYIYIGFIIAYWLYCSETPITNRNKYMVNCLLFVQLVGSILPVVREIQYPFSNAYRVNDLLTRVPPNERKVTDYWGLNAIAAFADKPFYCVDLQKEISFILWNNDLKNILRKQDRYTQGINDLFDSGAVNDVYMISTISPTTLSIVDPKLQEKYRVELMDKIEGAIEPGGNLYLYRISHH